MSNGSFSVLPPVHLLSLREGMDFHGWKMGQSNRFWREPGQRWSLVSVSSSHLIPPRPTNCELKRAKLLLQATCSHLLGEASHCWRWEGSHAIPSDSSILTSLLSFSWHREDQEYNVGWRNGSVVRGNDSFSRGPGIHSQCPHGDSNLSVTTVPEDPTPFSRLCMRQCTHTVHRHIFRWILHTYKVKINSGKKIWGG